MPISPGMLSSLSTGFGGLGGFAGGAAAPSSATSVSNPIDAKTQGITVAPIAVNFGELINALTPGAVNGGQGQPPVSFPTFSGDGISSSLSGLRTTNIGADIETESTSKFSNILMLTGLGLGGVVLARKFL
jgi:hypothetical protein